MYICIFIYLELVKSDSAEVCNETLYIHVNMHRIEPFINEPSTC